MPDNQAVAQPQASPVAIPSVTLAYHGRGDGVDEQW
jgi:hypothetical protein